MKYKILNITLIITILLFGINFVIAETSECNSDSDCELGTCSDGSTYEKYGCSNNECFGISYAQDPCQIPKPECNSDSDCELGTCSDGSTYEKYGCTNNECIPINYIQDPCEGCKFECDGNWRNPINCEVKSEYCENGCENGNCNTELIICQGGCICNKTTTICPTEQEPTITTKVQSSTSSTSTISLSKTGTDKISIQSGNVEIVTSEKVSVINSILTMQTYSGSTKKIKIMPETATTISKIESVNSIELIEESGKAVYSVSGTSKGRLIFVFPVTAETQKKINAETGKVISITKPWWSFLVSGI